MYGSKVYVYVICYVCVCVYVYDICMVAKYVYAYVYVCVCVYVYDICMVAKCLRTCVGSYGIIHMHAYRGRSGGQGRHLLPLSSLARDPRALALSVPGGSHVNGHAQRPG